MSAQGVCVSRRFQILNRGTWSRHDTLRHPCPLNCPFNPLKIMYSSHTDVSMHAGMCLLVCLCVFVCLFVCVCVFVCVCKCKSCITASSSCRGKVSSPECDVPT